jgi:magnesium-protoporphyrin IX monomethyl ester (oxidative) cyclase
LRTLLVNPPFTIHRRFFQNADTFPVGLASLAASLRAGGHEVGVLDAAAAGWGSQRREGDYVHVGIDDAELARRIRDFAPDLVGVSAPFSVQSYNARRVGEVAREAAPRATLVCGGAHVTALPRTLPEGSFDYLVLGEGELALPELAAALPLAPGDALPRGVLRCGEVPEGELELAVPPDLEQLPMPAYDRLDMPLYWRKRHYAKVVSTRGCPFTCSFCSVHVTLGHEIRKRSIDAIVEELRVLRRTYGVRQLDFEDDNLTAQMGWAKRLFQRLAEEDLDLEIDLRDGVRADRVDEELLRLMKDAGVVRLAYAPESGSQEVLDEIIGKRMRLEDVERAVRLAASVGIDVTCFLVIGFPRETRAQVDRTIRYGHELRRMGAKKIWLSCAAPHPGTRLWEECRQRGFVSDDMDLRLLRDPPALISTDEFTAAELGRLRDRAVRSYHPSRARTFVVNGLRTAFTDPQRFARRVGELLRPDRRAGAAP